MTSMQYVRLAQIQEVWESFSGWYWFVTEYHEGTLAFGLVRGWETEWGYFDLAELRELEAHFQVWKVPRKNWAVCPCVVSDDAVLCSWLKVGAVRERQDKKVMPVLPAMRGTIPRRAVQTQGAEQSGAGLHSFIKLKGGNWKMADEMNNKETATICPTKTGRGYKVVVNGTWFYTRKDRLQDMVSGKTKACTFRTIKDGEISAQ